METERYEAPVTEDVAVEVASFWERLWEGSATGPQGDPRALLQGAETSHNREILYLTRRNGKVIGTTQLVISRSAPILGGLGGVATDPEYRREGIATVLGAQAVDEFRAEGGGALFLGTVNPAAARVYRRLGYKKLASSIVYAYIVSGDSPEAFLTDYFRERGEATVREASPSERLSMIPLLCSPHDWQVLDANIGMLGIRYAILRGALFLYPRYARLWREKRGSWFAAHTQDLRLVGLSSAQLDDTERCRVDGFTHIDFPEAWGDLIRAATNWGASHGATSFEASVCVEDEDKQSSFESLGFRAAGAGDEFDFDGMAVGSILLEREGAPTRL